MPKFTLDTNVVVDALRVPEQLRGLKAFLQRALPVTYLSAVVLQELEAGVKLGTAGGLVGGAIGWPL